jgi:hypothetical protein
MFWEYVTDMSFVLIILIGSLVALFFAYMKKSNRKHVR